MPIKILMPALSPTMEHGNLAKWIKKEGDTISAGEVIAEIETDKATMEVEAVEEGVLAKIIVAEGSQEVPVNSLIAVLLEEEEDPSELESFIKGSSAPKKTSSKKDKDAEAEDKANDSEEKPAEDKPAKKIAAATQTPTFQSSTDSSKRIFA